MPIRWDRLHLGSEPISPALNSKNVALVRTLAQGLTQHEYGLREIRLFYEAVSPDRLHQFIFADYLATVLNQQQQYFESFRSESNRFPAPM